MIKKRLTTSTKNQLKMKLLYILLLILNIMLFIGLISYLPKFGTTHFNLGRFEEYSAIIAAMVTLGYISTKVPKIKNLGESSVFGIVYFPLICLIGMMTSYFTAKFDIALFFEPYLEMFKVLCAVLIFALLATNLNSFIEMIHGKHTRKNQMVCLVVFILLGLFASTVNIRVDDAPANIRCLIVMISGLFGGPIVGIPVGIISAAYRFTLGGPTALPCSISTVISGIIGSLIFIWNDRKFPNFLQSVLLMFLFTGFEMLVIIIATPPTISFPFIEDIYPIMLFASTIGMFLFTVVIKETKTKTSIQISHEEKRLKEFKDELEAYSDEKIEELKKEIDKLIHDKKQDSTQNQE